MELQFGARVTAVEHTRGRRHRSTTEDGRGFTGTHAVICMGMRAEHRRPGAREARASRRPARRLIVSTITCRTTTEASTPSATWPGGMMLASTAAMQGRHAAFSRARRRHRRADLTRSPWTIFTPPEVASTSGSPRRGRSAPTAPSRSPSTTCGNNPRGVISGQQRGHDQARLRRHERRAARRLDRRLPRIGDDRDARARGPGPADGRRSPRPARSSRRCPSRCSGRPRRPPPPA